jgi:hypothetical protein
MPLTEAECRKAGSQDKPYILSDGGGLQLYLLTSGALLHKSREGFI